MDFNDPLFTNPGHTITTHPQVSPEYRKQALQLALAYYDGAEVVAAEEVVKVAKVFYSYIYGKDV